MQNVSEITLAPPQKYDFGFGLIVAFCLVNVVFIVSKLFDVLSPKEVSLISDSNQLVSSCLVILMTLQVVRHTALDEKMRRSWRILTFAYFSYGIGNLFWFYYSTILNEKPFPTFADFGYWGFYPLMFWALLSFPTEEDNQRSRSKIFLDVGIVMLGGATVVWHFIIQPIIANGAADDSTAVFLNLCYTVGDLVLMLGISTILLRGVAANVRKTLYIIICGLVSMSIADYGFAYLTLQNTYYSGHWIDTFFQTSSLAFAIAAHYQYKLLSKPNQIEAETSETKTSFGWLPYLAIALGCGILLRETQPYWSEPLGFVVFASLGLTALVVFRQVVFARENMALREEQTKQQSETRFRTLVEHSLDMIIILDRQGKIYYQSPSVEIVLGYTDNALVGKHSLELAHPEDVGNVRADFKTLMKETGAILKREHRFRHANGTWRTIEGIAKSFHDETDNSDGILMNLRDITERKQDEEKLRVYTRRLERSNRELQDFAYVASHDLQEPLRKVQAFGDRLSRKFDETLGDEGRDYVRRMRDASARMQNLINDLLSFSRVSTKAQPFAPTDLKKVVSEVVSDLEIKIEQTGARVEIGNLPEIEADAVQMRQLFQNLVGNALKFQKPDEKPFVKIYTEDFSVSAASFQINGEEHLTVEDVCNIIVEDNGIGFDEKYLDKIFTVFQRLHGRSEYEGSGVGLAVCRKIAERHNGSITAQSTPEKGAKFIISLPLKQTEGEIK